MVLISVHHHSRWVCHPCSIVLNGAITWKKLKFHARTLIETGAASVAAASRSICRNAANVAVRPLTALFSMVNHSR